MYYCVCFRTLSLIYRCPLLLVMQRAVSYVAVIVVVVWSPSPELVLFLVVCAAFADRPSKCMFEVLVPYATVNLNSNVARRTF